MTKRIGYKQINDVIYEIIDYMISNKCLILYSEIVGVITIEKDEGEYGDFIEDYKIYIDEIYDINEIYNYINQIRNSYYDIEDIYEIFIDKYKDSIKWIEDREYTYLNMDKILKTVNPIDKDTNDDI